MDSQKLHYSLFTTQTVHGEKAILNLDAVTSIHLSDSGSYYVNLQNSDHYVLDDYNGQAAIAAWNHYKTVDSAKWLMPVDGNGEVAINRGLRQDAALSQIAELQQGRQSIKALLRQEEVYL